MISPDLLTYYSALILRELGKERGHRVGGHNITNIRYADDTILLAESEEDLQKLLDVVVVESERKGLNLNCKKTECLVISKTESSRCILKVNDRVIKQTFSFNYLGSIITEDARCVNEVKRRISVAKSTFSTSNNILRHRSLSMKVRFRVLDCYVYPVLMYGSEAWSITSDIERRLESCEM